MERFGRINNIDKCKLEPDNIRVHMEDIEHIKSSS
jgi:hypothetical protein